MAPYNLENNNSGSSQVDENLMSSQRSGDLRETRRSGGPGANTNDEPGNEPGEPGGESDPSTYREANVAAKRQKAAAASEDSESSIGGAVSAPVRKGTSNLLRAAWINLIPSWGLTLIWINIHIFLGMIFGNKYFCKLGVEWADQLPEVQAKSDGIKKKIDEKAGNSVGLVEKLGVGCADLGCLFLLIALGVQIALLLKVFELVANPFKAFGYLWDAAKQVITSQQ